MSFSAIIDQFPPATLALADGSIFNGHSIGAHGKALGEVVFNTSMTGYQEILSDPSYCNQIVTLTHPHIGNTGVNPDDMESEKVHAAGLVIRDFSHIASNWRSVESLDNFLKSHGVVAIAGVDTRRLTRLLRDRGAQNACIMTGESDNSIAVAEAQRFSGLIGVDLAQVVSGQQVTEWMQGTHQLDQQCAKVLKTPKFHVVAYDFGVKSQILRLLVDRGCRISLVPAKTPVAAVLALKPDGILLSNGPGDPAACDYAITNTQALLQQDIPLLGICLGFQLLALALNAATKKMKFGHHGANHPVRNVDSGVVFITSQNHGFVVDDTQLPADLVVTHRSLFDGTLQGFRHRCKPLIALQGHPEASPGPQDITGLFDDFVNLMQSRMK